jgi:hypothetical protein
MKSLWIEIAKVGLLVGFVSSGALAQSAIGQGPPLMTPPIGQTPNPVGPPTIGQAAGQLGLPPTGPSNPRTGAFVPLAGPWTTENVTAAQPFGNIDVSGAGKTTAQVRTWAQGRTPMERNELSGRCGVVGDPANSSRYPANAQEFCSTYTAMQVITPPTLNLKY